MIQPIASKIYDLYGQFYGAVEILFRRRLSRALAAVPFRTGDRVLDIGVGTGLSLEFYPSNVDVIGVDLSPGMLRQARRKVASGKVRTDCRTDATVLLQADALHLPFAAGIFDVVTLSHVVSTVADPSRCLHEALRVTRDQGTIIMVNHFCSPIPLINWVETAIDPICRKLGWRCDLSLEEMLAAVGAQRVGPAPRAPGLIFRIVCLQKCREGAKWVSLPAPTRRNAVVDMEPM